MNEQPTAFGRAMLAGLHNPHTTFSLTWRFPAQDHARPITFTARCHDFLEVRLDERRLLEAQELPAAPRILDLGCGIGRHLRWLRNAHPAAQLVGVEQCPGMLAHCQATVTAPADWFSCLDAALRMPAEGGFDAILLMGNGLGIGGVEQDCEAMLARLAAALAPGGVLVIESMPPPMGGGGYGHAMTTIEAYGQTDGPFPWGFATSAWLAARLRALGLQTEVMANNAPGPGVYFAVGARG